MGQKINPTSLRLRENIDENAKWFLSEDYSDGLHNDIQVKEYLSNFLKKKNILLGGSVLKRKKSSVQIYAYMYPLASSRSEGASDSEIIDNTELNNVKQVSENIRS